MIHKKSNRKNLKSRGGIKRDALDAAVSDLVREKANWCCVRCQRYFPPGQARLGLSCSHYFGRTIMATRYDLENCDSLCTGCHALWEKEQREDYRAFKIRQLGQQRFDMLCMRAHRLMKWTSWGKDELKKQYRTELKELQERGSVIEMARSVR